MMVDLCAGGVILSSHCLLEELCLLQKALFMDLMKRYERFCLLGIDEALYFARLMIYEFWMHVLNFPF